MRFLRNLVGRRDAEPRPLPTVAVASPASATDSTGSTIAQARVLSDQGLLAGALKLLNDALVLHPHNADLHYARGLTLLDWGRHAESRVELLGAAASGVSNFGLQINLAHVAHLMGLPDEAERHCRLALSLNPNSAAAHFGLGAICQSTEHHAEAVAAYREGFRIEPERGDALCHIASSMLDSKDNPGAEEAARLALTVDGENPKSWAILGMALYLQERHADSFAAFERAEAIERSRGQAPDAFVNHGLALLNAGRVDETVALYEENLARVPNPIAHKHYAFALMTLGRWREGLEQYEFRWFQQPFLAARKHWHRPRWAGQALAGRTVLMTAEQGAGDLIQYARFARDLKAQGGTVVLETAPALAQFASGFEAVDRVVGTADHFDAYDFYVPLMSLPRALRIDPETPSAPPYYRADAARIARLRPLVPPTSDLKIGLVWAGNSKHQNDKNRSITLATIASLWDIGNVRFHSFQKERPARDLGAPEPGEMVDFSPHLEDFGDTAALLGCMDLLITVDTAVAHLAGAMGKPVWLLLPFVADFRWLRARADTPWYPSMRLFRQSEQGSWTDAIDRVRVALQEAANDRTGSALAPPAWSAQALPLPPVTSAATMPRRLAQVAETRYGILQHWPDDVPLAEALSLQGEWLHALFELTAGLIAPGASVLQVGAGIGQHTVGLARVIGPAGHLWAYEPDLRLRRLLAQNIQANGVAGNVTMLRESAASGEQQSEATGMQDTVDSFWLERLDLIRIDSPTHLQAIIEGCSETLWRTRPFVVVLLPDDAETWGIVAALQSFGYCCWRGTAPAFLPSNFNRREIESSPSAGRSYLVAVPEEREVPSSVGRLEPAVGDAPARLPRD